MKKFFVFVVLVLSCFALTSCKKKEDLTKLSTDLSKYSINIDFDAQNKMATVNQELDYVNHTGTVVRNIKFHLYPQFFKEGAIDKVVGSTKMSDAYPNGISYAEFDILSIKVDGNAVPAEYEGENDGILNVQLPNSLMPEKDVKFNFEFSFKLPNAFHRFGYGKNTINLANFYPIACVYENGGFNVSPYNSNGDPFYSDMANYYVSINLDKNYLVASTGDCVDESTSGDKKTCTFKANMVRDFALVLSNKFELISEKQGNTTINYYYFDDENAETNLKAGVDAIATFNKLFGEYPYDSFSIVKTDFVYGGMEYPNLIMISADVSDPDDYKNVIIHETAHQWWYGMVGNDEFNLPWLDEALTEYSSVIFYDYNEGYNLSHEEMVKTNKQNYSLFISVYEDVLGKIDTSMRAVNEYSTEPEYTYCTYVKGVLMFDSLYHLVGEKDFVKSLKTYFEENKYKNASKENLVNAFEKTCKTDLTGFFDSWLNGKVVIR